MDMRDNVKLYFKICNNIMQSATKSLRGLMTEKDWASLALQCDREGQGFDFNSLVHPSTEAFFLLIIENNHEQWKKMYVNKKEIETIKSSYLTLSDHHKAMKKLYNDQGIHPQKYTGHHGTGKNGGWSRAGKVRYNMIYDKVLEDRTPEKSSAFNNCFIMHYQKMKRTIATLTTGKEEGEQPLIKMRFLGHGIDPKLMAEV
jgi:hypothetical protein